MLNLSVRYIKKHGNVIIDISFDEMKSKGVEIGDIITVIIGRNEYDMPVVTSFSDVNIGEMICRFDYEDNEASLAVNMGSFANIAGIGEKHVISEEPYYTWDINIKEISLFLKEKGGYLSKYNTCKLLRTNNRADYAELTDEEFANFRALATDSVKPGWVYRSSTPIGTVLGRNEYIIRAMKGSGIKSVINLADSVDRMLSYETFQGSYYSECNIINLDMNYDFSSEEFSNKFKAGIEFIVSNEGPYLIHCKEGKDRTGIFCAILECFAGASAKEIMNDYMITYYNFYKVKPKSEAYEVILNNNIIKTLCKILKVDDFLSADLKKAATEYLTSIGVATVQLEQLVNTLKE